MKVLIIYSPDEWANGVKPVALEKYLRARGCEVELYSAQYLSRVGKMGLAAILPRPAPLHLALYFVEGFAAVVDSIGKILQKTPPQTISKWAFMKQVMQLRGAILRRKLSNAGYDMIICENGWDIGFVAGRRVAKTQILDIPVPFAEECYYGGQISHRNFSALRDYEVGVYAKADRIGFHWHNYADYVKEAKYNGSNFIDLSYGVNIPTKRASFDAKPRIAFLGWLGGYWINLPLLKRLCEIYPHIDIYGSPPFPEFGENYKGYAPTPDVLANYQFGLVTLRDDPLRRAGFSSKQLRYYSYGLPVLSPSWHRDSVLDEAALLYDEENFLQLIHDYSDKQKWTELSEKAFEIARRYEWENVLRPLDPFLSPAQVPKTVNR